MRPRDQELEVIIGLLRGGDTNLLNAAGKQLADFIKDANMSEMATLAQHSSLLRSLPSPSQALVARQVLVWADMLTHQCDSVRRAIIGNLPDKDPEQKRLPLQVQPDPAPA